MDPSGYPYPPQQGNPSAGQPSTFPPLGYNPDQLQGYPPESLDVPSQQVTASPQPAYPTGVNYPTQGFVPPLQYIPTAQQQTSNVVVVQAQPTVVMTGVNTITSDYFLTLSIVMTFLCCCCGGWWSLLCTVAAMAIASGFGGKGGPTEPAVDPILEGKLKEIDQLTDVNQINDKVVAMLDDTNVRDETARQHILRQSIKDKKQMLVGWVKKDNKPSGIKDGGPSTPEGFVDELRKFDFSNDTAIEGYHSTMDKLRLSLSSNGLSWVEHFGEKEGLKALLMILRSCAEESYQDRLCKIQHTCVRCLIAFMNNKYGLGQVLQSEDAIITFVTAMDPYNENMMADVLMVTAAVCLVDDGHSKVLEAVTVNSEQCDTSRFEPILRALENTNNLTLQLSCMQFINAIVNTPDDPDFRIHLRNEFMRGGLGEQLEALRKIQAQDLVTQLEIFDTHLENDFEKMLHRFQDIEAEFNEPESAFNSLMLTCQGTGAASYLLSILQHLLLIQNDFYARPQYFKLIDACVTQIVLHKNGIDPDFSYTQKFKIDVDNIIDGLVDKARVEEAEQTASDFEQQLCKEKDICEEIEARLLVMETNQTRFEQVLAERNDEIKQLKDELSRRPTIMVTDPNAAAEAPTPPPPPGPGGDLPPPTPPLPGPGGGPPPPPPPPPCPGGGPPLLPPPPPCPGGDLPPPPPQTPPPGMEGDSCGMEKKKYRVNVQMRRIHWEKIQKKQLSSNSFWAQTNEELLESSDLLAEIESTFGTGKVTEETLSEVKHPPLTKLKQLKVIGHELAQKMSMMLGIWQMKHEAIRDMVLSFEEKIEEQKIKQLIKIMKGCSNEQMTQLQAYKDKISELSDAEQFVVVMSDVKGLQDRLECWLFRVQFEEEHMNLMKSITSVIDACHETRTSRKFGKLLEIVLLMGNYMNAGSRNAQSFGFNLRYLTKLTSTKSADQKITLLHFLASTVGKRFPDVLTFKDELKSVESASQVSKETVGKGVARMEQLLKMVKDEAKKHDLPQDAEKFPQEMKDFIAMADDKYLKMKDDYERMEQAFDELATFYCFDKKITLEELFGDISEFVKDFERARQENEKVSRQLEKQRQQKEKKVGKRKEKAKQKKTEKRRPPALTFLRAKSIQLSSRGEKEHVLDTLYSHLKSGDVWGSTRGNPFFFQ